MQISLPSQSQHLFTNSPSRCTVCFTATATATAANHHSPINCKLSFPIPSCNVAAPLYSQCLQYKALNHKFSLDFALKPNNFSLKAYQSDDAWRTQSSDGFSLDAFLSIAELLCFLSSAIVSVGYALNCTALGSKRTVLGVIGSNGGFAWGVVVLASGMAIGAWIRRRQWRRICGETARAGGGESVNLVGRIEKLEEDLRTSVTVIRVLSRQVEKLGIRFRLTRKSLKQPIAETAALAQKNSEATRALAVQEDILENELGEMQKVLLAMQEQQQKQLELILAIGKTGKLWESKQVSNQEEDMIETSDLKEGVKQLETHEVQASSGKGTNNDRP